MNGARTVTRTAGLEFVSANLGITKEASCPLEFDKLCAELQLVLEYEAVYRLGGHCLPVSESDVR